MNTHNTSRPMRILVGYDGSEHVQTALALLADLCPQEIPAFKAHVSLLAVFTPLLAGDQDPLRDSLQGAHTTLERSCFQVESEIILGYPAEKLMEYSETLKPDLIVLGAKGLRSAFGILLGGVAQQIVEYASCPVLVVRAPYRGLQNWLLVIDGSQSSQYAAQFLKQFHIPPGASLHVLYVLPPLPLQPPEEVYLRTYLVAPEVLPVYPVEPTPDMIKWQEEEAQKGQRLIDSTIQDLQGSGIASTGVLLRGDAAKEIISYASQIQADLIICGSRGLSTFKGWLLGSVSRKLIHYASCSVLVVREAHAVHA